MNVGVFNQEEVEVVVSAAFVYHFGEEGIGRAEMVGGVSEGEGGEVPSIQVGWASCMRLSMRSGVDMWANDMRNWGSWAGGERASLFRR